ncbi:MAG TPA: hypothetical protein VIO61_12660 [Anaerolineaceae bacterium]
MIEIPLRYTGQLFAMPMPFSGFDPAGAGFSACQKKSVRVIVMLIDDDEATAKTRFDLRSFYLSQDIEVIYFPITDFGVPDLVEMHRAGTSLLKALQQGKNAAVHCHAGIGRTGLFCAYLGWRVLALRPQEAITWIRQFIPHAIESNVQRDLLLGLEQDFDLLPQ